MLDFVAFLKSLIQRNRPVERAVSAFDRFGAVYDGQLNRDECMTAKSFVDTNVLLYAIGKDADSDKAADLDDATARDEKYGLVAMFACASGADDYLRSAVKYDFKWDETGFFDMNFDKHAKSVVSTGVLTFVSDKIKIQNAFGTY